MGVIFYLAIKKEIILWGFWWCSTWLWWVLRLCGCGCGRGLCRIFEEILNLGGGRRPWGRCWPPGCRLPWPRCGGSVLLLLGWRRCGRGSGSLIVSLPVGCSGCGCPPGGLAGVPRLPCQIHSRICRRIRIWRSFLTGLPFYFFRGWSSKQARHSRKAWARIRARSSSGSTVKRFLQRLRVMFSASSLAFIFSFGVIQTFLFLILIFLPGPPWLFPLLTFSRIFFPCGGIADRSILSCG